MTHLRSLSMALCLLAAAGCTGMVTGGGNGGGSGGGNQPGVGGGSDVGGGPGSNMGTGDGSGSDPGVNTQPTYPTQHPRIYISANKARLQAALNAGRPAAKRFKQIVDAWVGGRSEERRVGKGCG